MYHINVEIKPIIIITLHALQQIPLASNTQLCIPYLRGVTCHKTTEMEQI